MMSVNLTPHIEDLIRRKIAAGPYRSADEVIEDALQALEERDRLARLRGAIAVGDAQLAAGEGILYSSDVLDKIEREAEATYRRGDRPSPVVCP
jgi:antitoxin ParD1/3/4